MFIIDTLSVSRSLSLSLSLSLPAAVADPRYPTPLEASRAPEVLRKYYGRYYGSIEVLALSVSELALVFALVLALVLSLSLSLSCSLCRCRGPKVEEVRFNSRFRV